MDYNIKYLKDAMKLAEKGKLTVDEYIKNSEKGMNAGELAIFRKKIKECNALELNGKVDMVVNLAKKLNINL